MNMQQRQTAFKMWIGDLISSKFEKREGDMPLNYIKFKDINISRVNIIANVIFKFENDEKTYLTVTLDDGTGNVRLKAWREDSDLLKDLNVGDLVLVIGKPRVFNNEIYIAPEIVKVLNDLNWSEVRKLELVKGQGEYKGDVKRITEVEQQRVVEEEVVSDEPSESSRARVLNIIEKNSSGDGADLDDVISKSGLGESECNNLINELLKEGEIFSPRPGKIKLID
jgi:RPA family protein